MPALPPMNATLAAIAIAGTVYVALLACAQALRKLRNVRFGWTYHPFAIAMSSAIAIASTPLAAPWREAWVHHLTAAAVILAAFPVVALVNAALWSRTLPDGTRADAPALLADTTRILVVVGIALVVLQFHYGVKVPGLLAGSGLLAIILGLAMQDLLGNVMAGFALYAAKPFKTGDWLLVDGYHARVVELTWRSTRLLTTDDVFLDVPNTDLVKRPVVNFNQPARKHAIRTTIGLHFDAPPARVAEVLREAAASVPGVCAEPRPAIFVKQFADSAIVYEVKVWIEEHDVQARILSDVHSHCWYAAQRAGLEIPYPQLTVRRPTAAAPTAVAQHAAAHALRTGNVFSFLSAEQVASLVSRARVVLFAPGERLVQQEEVGSSMFVLVRGEVEVRVARGGRMNVVKQLGPGDCLGEMSLLTDEPRSATAVATGEVEAVEITRAGFAALIQDAPQLLGPLSELVTQRQSANQQLAVGDVATQEAVRAGVLQRLRSFFDVTG